MRPNSVRYKPEFCDLVIQMGEEGKSQTAMYATIGCDKKSFRNWAEKYEDFAAALCLARAKCQAVWEARMVASLGTKTANGDAQIYRIVMQSWFPHDYRPVTTTELTGKDGGPIETIEKKPVEEIVKGLSEAEKSALATDPKIAALLGLQQQTKH